MTSDTVTAAPLRCCCCCCGEVVCSCCGARSAAVSLTYFLKQSPMNLVVVWWWLIVQGGVVAWRQALLLPGQYSINTPPVISCRSSVTALLLAKNNINNNDPRLGRYVGINEFDEEYLKDDIDMEKDMARDLFEQLRSRGVDDAEPGLLSLHKFFEWDDMKEVLAKGFIDMNTMDTILSEAGVVRDALTFDQFYEVVDLVNQVQIALEDGSGSEGINDEYDTDGNEDDSEEDILSDPDFKAWLNKL